MKLRAGVAASCLGCLRGSSPWHAIGREHGLGTLRRGLAAPRRYRKATALLPALRRASPLQNGAAREARRTIPHSQTFAVRVHMLKKALLCRLSARRHSLA